MDLNSMSDEELKKIAQGGPQSPALDLNSLSDDELKQIASGQHLDNPGFFENLGKNILEGAVKAGKFVDSYTGAPTRAAIGAIQDKKSPLSAFASQFGENPDLAPTGQDIAIKMGASTDQPLIQTAEQAKKFDEIFNPGWAASMKQMGRPYEEKRGMSDATQGGLAIDLLADPTNLLPLVPAAKGVVAGARGVLGGVGAAAGKGAELLAKATIPEKIIQTAEKTAAATKEALNSVFKPSRAPDFKQFAEIATKNGIDPSLLPESVEFGPSSVISRGARALREGPAGQIEMKKFEDAFFQVQGAADKKIEKIAGGVPLTEIEAGHAIRQGYDNAVEKLFNDVDFTYNQVIGQIPGAKLVPKAEAQVASKLASIEKFAIGRVKRGITNTDRAQGQQLLRAVQAVRESNGSLKQAYEAMQDIGRVAFKTSNTLSDVPVDKAKLKDLYLTLRDAFIDSTDVYLGKDIGEQLRQNNQKISEFLENKSVVSNLIGNDAVAEERLFQGLVKNGDTKKIQALKEILPPNEFNKLKGTLLESLVKRNPDGTINFGNLYNAMQNKQNVLSAAFDPQEIAEFAELVQLGNRFGPMVLSTSGTGGSNIFRNMLEGVQSGVSNRATLDLLKDQARSRSINPPLRQNIISPSKFKALPRRTGADDALKYLQLLGTQVDTEDTAAKRRFNQILKNKIKEGEK